MQWIGGNVSIAHQSIYRSYHFPKDDEKSGALNISTQQFFYIR